MSRRVTRVLFVMFVLQDGINSPLSTMADAIVIKCYSMA